jgi:methyl coenzyme M reductase subunit D
MTTRIDIRLGYKVNMGNYESLDISFSVSDDAKPGENAQQAFDRVYGFVEANLSKKVAEARGGE